MIREPMCMAPACLCKDSEGDGHFQGHTLSGPGNQRLRQQQVREVPATEG